MFIAVYTHQLKDYCSEQFFSNLQQLAGGNHVHIVDNTVGTEYFDKLTELTKDFSNTTVEHLYVSPEPDRTRFLRSVADSANACRDAFLATSEQHFLIIESDVIPPVDVIDRLEKRISELDDYAAIGCLYYHGFHDYGATGLQNTHHCLSGCTVYNRKYLQDIPFRWSEDNLGAFSDAWWCVSIGELGLQHLLFNDHDIHCDHISKSNGSRGY